MSTLAKASRSIEMEARGYKVRVTDDSITVELVDGRTISVPIVWFSRLANASPDEQQNFRLIAGGRGIHWPDVDEHLSIAGFLRTE